MELPTIEQPASEQPREVSSTQLLDTALYYAKELGWAIFPAHPTNKRPLTTHGFKDATTNRERIIRWWQKHPNALIACPTGENIKAFVFDLAQLEHFGLELGR
jgi:putative DNA primase/helicase